MVSNSRFSKYLIYAIGEIILVVLGILIALQVNNWNETRLNRNELDQLLLDLEEFMSTQKVLFNREINKLKETDSIMDLILTEGSDYKELIKIRLDTVIFNHLELPFRSLPKHYIEFSNIENLVNRKEDFPDDYWQMIYDLEGLLRYSEELTYKSELASKAAREYRDYLFQVKPQIFKTDSVNISFNSYILNDPTSTIRLREIKNYTEGILGAFNRYNYSSAKISAIINYQLNEVNADDIQAVWTSFNIPQLRSEICQKENFIPKNQKKQRHGRILVFNDKNTSIPYKLLNSEEEVILERTIDPKTVSFFYGAPQPNYYITYQIDGDCFIITEPSEYGFIVISE